MKVGVSLWIESAMSSNEGLHNDCKLCSNRYCACVQVEVDASTQEAEQLAAQEGFTDADAADILADINAANAAALTTANEDEALSPSRRADQQAAADAANSDTQADTTKAAHAAEGDPAAGVANDAKDEGESEGAQGVSPSDPKLEPEQEPLPPGAQDDGAADALEADASTSDQPAAGN